MELLAIQKCTLSRPSVRDNTSAEHKSGEKPHSQTMNMKIAFEAYNNAPADCYTVTYNNKSQLQSFYYCPHHEYTY